MTQPGRKKGLPRTYKRGAKVLRIASPITPEQQETWNWLNSIDPIARIEWLTEKRKNDQN